jgi:T5SS/PEP-CTERM-associated repeat protein
MNFSLVNVTEASEIRRCDDTPITRRFLGLLAVLCAPAHVEALDKFWGNQTGGTFNLAANWQGGSVAGSNDAAHFGLTTSNSQLQQKVYSVGFTNDVTNQALFIEDDRVTFDFNFSGFDYTAVGTIIGNQANRTGRLAIIEGDFIATSTVQVGTVDSSTGLLFVGAGGQLLGTASLNIGLSGFGDLRVEPGGKVLLPNNALTTIGSVASRFATATINGELNTNNLHVGFAGNGTLTIGGFVQANSNSTIGTSTGSVGTVNLSFPTAQWRTTLELAVGSSGKGTLNVANGAVVMSHEGIVGKNSAGTGDVTVDGAGSRWSSTEDLIVGDAGTGTLQIKNGGTVEDSRGFVGQAMNGTGHVIVDGAGSLWDNSGVLVIGFSGAEGTIEVTGGATMRSSLGFIANGPGSVGHVTVEGSGSFWDNSGFINVAPSGDGTLSIRDGGIVECVDSLVGHQTSATGHVIVEGSGSVWDLSGGLTVGGDGIGALAITGGAQVNSNGSTLGSAGNSLGTVTVNGHNSTWSSLGSLVVGGLGHGRVDITGGGRVISHTGLIASESSSTGTVTVAGTDSTGARSTLFVGGRLEIGVGTSGGHGRLHIQPGGFVTVAEGIVLGDDGELFLEGGTLSSSEIDFMDGGSPGPNFVWTSGTLHVGTYNGDLTVPNGGVLAPGNSAGRTEILGDYASLPGATLEMEIGGPTQSTQYDFLTVDGNMALDGNLQLTLTSGFVPTAAQLFFIGGAGGTISGEFDNVASGQRLTTSDGLGSFVVRYGPENPLHPNLIILSEFLQSGLLRGDFNGDGLVNAVDIDLLASAAHNDPDNILFDLNDDGMVTFTVGQPNAPDPSDSDVLIHEILETRYGDADVNGQVFLSDLTRLATNYRQPGQFGWAQGNFNGSQEAGTAANPRVFLSDLTALATNWRFGVGGSGASVGEAVPEPTSPYLALGIGLIALARRARCYSRG